MTLTRFASALAIVILTVATPVSAEKVTEFDRFRLWNQCAPLRIVMSDNTKEAKKIGLTESLILVTVRSRLRAARIYSAKEVFPPSLLAVRVTVGEGGTFHMAIEFVKYLRDDINEISRNWRAVTWRSESFGTHGSSSNYVLSALSRHIDSFIDEYLRVNASACKS